MKIVFGRLTMSIATTAVLLWSVSPVLAQSKAKAKVKAPAPAKTVAKKSPTAAPKAAPKALAKPAVSANPTDSGTNPLNAKVTDRHRFTLISVEEKVSSLKEKVFRSKAQLLLLQETLLQGEISTSKIKLVHDDKIGNSFYLMSAAYSLDGTPIFSRSDQSGSLNKKRKFNLFSGSIRPGTHELSVELRYRGNGFGVFSYLRGYKIRIRSSYSFSVQEGRAVTIRVQPFQLNWTYPIRKRIKVQYKMKANKLVVKRKKLQDVLQNKK